MQELSTTNREGCSRQRKLHYDLLRIVAIYMVLYTHTGERGFKYFTVANDSGLYWLYLFFSILIKVAVPLFFMVSGALLLPRDEPIKTVVKKRFLRFLLVLVVFSFISYLYSVWGHFYDFSLTYFIRTVYSSDITWAYWYLYAYLGYIVVLPLLRRLARAMSDREYIYLFAAYAAYEALVIAQFLIWKGTLRHNGSFSLFFTSWTVLFPLMGYYFEYRLPERAYQKKYVLIALASGCTVVAVCGLMTHYEYVLTGEYRETFFDGLTFVPAFAAYYCAKYLLRVWTPKERTARWITRISSCTFGVFLLEQVYRNWTRPIYDALAPRLTAVPACLVWIFAACVLGTAVTLVLKKIPGLSKLL